MNVNELMPGDWVARKNVPSERLKIIDIFTYRNLVFTELDGMGVTEKADNLEGIQITKKILEKNGLLMEKNPCFGDIEYKSDLIMLRSWNNGQTFRVHYYMVEDNRDFCFPHSIQYVHELQHLIKVCKIDKEIIL